ncbi:MAG: serine/threonine protein kinase, partial [Planctomycetes bacterium]|nr:serine/threonine protein kinase [Planctomycetota bacterium]
MAVKVFAARDLDAPLSRMVTEEANKARRINHPNVVRVIDKGTVDDMEYIVHEYIDGGNLHSWTAARSGLPTPVEAARLVVQISRGVQAVHSAGLAHCDLKPSNVLIDKEGTAKVADFGVARRLAQSDDPEQTRSESPVGNLAFQAPELYHRERGAIAPRADIYALGGLLMFLISGIPPNGSDIGEVRSFLENCGSESDTERFGPLSILDHDLQV